MNFIFDVTPDNFTTLVIDNSRKGPVLVNYWAPYAGPCLKLWPSLEKLAQEFNGRFLLVNVNTERENRLAREQGINSVPTLKVYRNGAVVDEVYGAESENGLRALLGRHVPRPSDLALGKAVQRFQAGDEDGAFTQLVTLAVEDPANPRVPLTLAKLLMRTERHDEVIALLRAAEILHDDQEAIDLRAHAELRLAAREADQALIDKANTGSTLTTAESYRLAALALQHDDFENALDLLLEILRRERAFGEGAAHRGMTAIFRMLGRDQPLTVRYRAQLLELSN